MLISSYFYIPFRNPVSYKDGFEINRFDWMTRDAETWRVVDRVDWLKMKVMQHAVHVDVVEEVEVVDVDGAVVVVVVGGGVGGRVDVSLLFDQLVVLEHSYP